MPAETSDNSASCLIVGAGVTGLLAGCRLREKGHAVTILDSERAVGGRMSTIEIDGAHFDHGTQFFVGQEGEFRDLITQWEEAGAATRWGGRFLGEQGHDEFRTAARYCGAGGMSAIAQHLAAELDVRLGQEAVRAEMTPKGWCVSVATGETYSAQSLLLTAPVPSSLRIIDTGGVELPAEIEKGLEAVTYQPCLVLLALLDGPSGLPEPGGIKLNSSILMWLGDNKIKGVSPGTHAVTLQTSGAFSDTHLADDEESVKNLISNAAIPFLQGIIKKSYLHRWKYGRVTNVFDAHYAWVDGQCPVAFAGDAFGGPCVEGAAISALRVAERLADYLG
ncbi:MAG: FAD-dependent oxidoreductase [Verrucomicrobia bacterium]|nr:FAD-dependent oxidoreductase [Verrucomicrobiota bacterium]